MSLLVYLFPNSLYRLYLCFSDIKTNRILFHQEQCLFPGLCTRAFFKILFSFLYPACSIFGVVLSVISICLISHISFYSIMWLQDLRENMPVDGLSSGALVVYEKNS